MAKALALEEANPLGAYGSPRERRPKAVRWTVALLVIVLALGLSALFYLRERGIAALREELQRVEHQKEQLLQENERLRVLLARKDDLDYIEYLARKELGLILPGEEKYILIEGGQEP